MSKAEQPKLYSRVQLQQATDAVPAGAIGVVVEHCGNPSLVEVEFRDGYRRTVAETVDVADLKVLVEVIDGVVRINEPQTVVEVNGPMAAVTVNGPGSYINIVRARSAVVATDDGKLRAFAEYMAQELDCSVMRAEKALRSLLAKGLVERVPDAD